jgi:hypothetical protein
VTADPLCSTVVYDAYWVLTAAHCFPGDADANHDDKITSAELPIVVGPLAVDSAGRLGNVTRLPCTSLRREGPEARKEWTSR